MMNNKFLYKLMKQSDYRFVDEQIINFYFVLVSWCGASQVWFLRCITDQHGRNSATRVGLFFLSRASKPNLYFNKAGFLCMGLLKQLIPQNPYKGLLERIPIQ